MRKVFLGLVLGLTTVFHAHASTLSLAGGAGTLLWGTPPYETFTVQIDDNSAGFSKTIFDFNWEAADNANATIDTYDLWLIDAWNGNILSYKTTIGAGNTFTEPVFPDFPTYVALTETADPSNGIIGAGNYVGFSLQNGADTHYGWLQFEFRAFEAGGVALVFLDGYINDLPGGSVEAGVIPEPSTLALLGGSLVLLPFYRRFRRKG